MTIADTTLGYVEPLIRKYEQGPNGGFANTAYLDVAGNWTIGWGHKLTVNDPLRQRALTQDDADALMLQDLDRQNSYLDACLTSQVWAALNACQQGALIDWVFNLGIGAFERSTLHHFVAENRLDQVPAEIQKWVYAGNPPKVLNGLVSRRMAEVALWNQIPVIAQAMV